MVGKVWLFVGFQQRLAQKKIVAKGVEPIPQVWSSANWMKVTNEGLSQSLAAVKGMSALSVLCLFSVGTAED